MTTKDFKCNVNLTGYCVKDASAKDSKSAKFVKDFDLQVRGQFASPLDINHVRRVGRALHVLESCEIVILHDAITTKFTVNVNAKSLTTKYQNRAIVKSRSKTIIKSRKMIDTGVDLHELITYLISKDVLDYTIARKTKPVKVIDAKHKAMLAKQAKAKALLAELNADIKVYTSTAKAKSASTDKAQSASTASTASTAK